MKNVIALIAVAGVAAAASAQITAPVVSWEVSTDGGASWTHSASVTSPSPTSVMVRGSLSWTRGANNPISALAAVSFDGTVTSSLAAIGETGSSLVKPLTQSVGGLPGAFRSAGNTMVFSASTDSGAAGSNPNWWIIGQDANADLNGDGQGDFPGQNTSDPVVFLTFSIGIDYSANHTVSIGSILSNRTGSASAIRIYNNVGLSTAGATTNFLNTAVVQQGATIDVLVPTPGSLALLGLGGLVAGRRRR